ncbi:deoxyribonuclease 1 like 4, tandem duplicate 1 isoform X1 [Latimeria chalumnae]|uniref:deoxyribonuclease 1 like 4, tandem duplicate 1 isoform X1 n=1 Tax=Latimeria chalumnae TaxID=7897 RepID=UPI00313E764B
MKIAAFNAERFGQSKSEDPKVLSIITRIVSRYDIILILEVTDVKQQAFLKLLEQLNNSDSGLHYSHVMSKRLGRSSYKEQYLFLYRDDVVQVKDIYQYEDNQAGDEDAFSREPFVVKFSSPNTVIKEFVLIPVHTKPEDSVKEIDELYDVFLAVKKKWKTEKIMFLGDFNADGSYVSGRRMKNIRLRSNTNFHWLIGDNVDTTTNSGNDNSYDRIVIHEELYKMIVPGSAKSFNFQEAFCLTHEEALDVSDHYPVEVELKTDL